MKSIKITLSALTFYVMILLLNNCKESSTDPVPTATVSLPTVTTSDISAITQVTASGGGEVKSDGGATVTARGLCWSTNPVPTISDSKKLNGTGKGVFSISISGLSLGTKYYVRAFATNSKGTAYGEEKSFTTDATLALGLPYAGGTIYYLDSTNKHGFVFADTILGEARWGCNNKALVGARATEMGKGAQNTLDIMKECNEFYSAADIVSRLVFGGYSDWFLPSRDELIPIHFNIVKKGIGKLPIGHYWTSTQMKQSEATFAETIRVGDDGGQQNGGKLNNTKVVAVRAF
jgi:hypothetical protein